jgi:aerobic-type carbon monoxide dehydrogenase small subunit (CoxS/CutS family)
MVALNVNGKNYQADVDLRTPLLWVLRDTLDLTGTKYGCGIAQRCAQLPPSKKLWTISERAI